MTLLWPRCPFLQTYLFACGITQLGSGNVSKQKLLIFHSFLRNFSDYLFSEWGPTLLEIRTTATVLPDGEAAAENYPTMNIALENTGIWLMDQAKLPIEGWSFPKVFKKWTHYCISIDFLGNTVQVAYNGNVFEKILKPQATVVMYANQFGGQKSLDYNESSEYLFIFGRYFFDNTKVFAKYAGFYVWERLLTESELKDLSSCNYISRNIDDRLVVNLKYPASKWVERIDFDEQDLLCTQSKQELLIPMPIPPINKIDAVNICKKFGDFGELAGEFKNEDDFKRFYTTTNQNVAYRHVCSQSDAGRLKTWLPYTINDMSKIVNDISGEELTLNYFAEFFRTPEHSLGLGKTCLSGYFGDMMLYKKNLYAEVCSALQSVVCKVPSSLERTATIRLRGVCRFSVFDDVYQVTVEAGQLKYYGLKRTVILYNSSALAWQMTDVIDSRIRATFESGFRSLGLGTNTWRIEGDLSCQKGEVTVSVVL